MNQINVPVLGRQQFVRVLRVLQGICKPSILCVSIYKDYISLFIHKNQRTSFCVFLGVYKALLSLSSILRLCECFIKLNTLYIFLFKLN